jgi:hypothetical protein
MGGDFVKDEFTDEEKAALGEVTEETVKEPEHPESTESTEVKTEDTEIKTEETKPDPETQSVIDAEGGKLITENGKQYVVDEDGAKIPLDRFKKVYGKSKELEREKEETTNKFNLFKELGAEEYYKKYPDEKPADFKPVKEDPPAVDFNSMPINGGKYDGWTLGEVAKEDPVAAQLMLNNYLESKRAAVEIQRRKDEEGIKTKAEEGNRFKWERAKELFGKEKDYTEEEIKQVNEVYTKLGDWMRANKKLHYSLEDAHLLMNKDKIIKDERIKASKAALEEATKKGVTSIGNGDSTAGLTGFEAIMAMSEDALTKHIDRMSDKEQKTFYKDAPKSIREKYPSLPW